MNIRIISDMGEVYEPDTIMSLEELKEAYEEANWMDEQDENAIAWDGWKESEIVRFIADAWGLDYEIIQ